eukprot:SAG31_NODE_6811_length_1880_cov_1.650197_2_plen_287_part_00
MATLPVGVGNLQYWVTQPEPQPEPEPEPEPELESPRPLPVAPTSLADLEEIRLQLIEATHGIEQLLKDAATKIVAAETTAVGRLERSAATTATAAAAVATKSAEQAAAVAVDVRAEVDRLVAAAGGPRLSTGRRPRGQLLSMVNDATPSPADVQRRSRWVPPAKQTRRVAATRQPTRTNRNQTQELQLQPELEHNANRELDACTAAAVQLMQALPKTFFQVRHCAMCPQFDQFLIFAVLIWALCNWFHGDCAVTSIHYSSELCFRIGWGTNRAAHRAIREIDVPAC